MPLTHESGEPVTVGFIGAGQMGGAMLRGLARTGTVQAANLSASDLVQERLDELKADVKGVNATKSNMMTLKAADVIVLGVEPKDMESVCSAIPHDTRIFVSLAAGTTLSSLASWLPANVPIVRVMPNTPCTVGAMAAGYCCNANCTPAQAALVGALLGALGSALRVEDEADLDAVTGVSGSGPAYVFQFIEAMSDGGVRCGLARNVATQLAAQTVVGAGKMVLETGMHPGALKDMVTSPGGTTIAAVHALESGGLRAAVINAVVAATEKSRQLGGAAKAKDEAKAAGNKRAREGESE